MTSDSDRFAEAMRLADEAALQRSEEFAPKPRDPNEADPFLPDRDPFGVDWRWVLEGGTEPAREPSAPGASPPLTRVASVGAGRWKDWIWRNRRWRAVAITAVAVSMVVLVVLGGRRFLRGPQEGKSVVLACLSTSTWAGLRDGKKEWLLRVKSPINGFVTVVALAPDRKPRVLPVYGGDDLPVENGTSEPIGLPGGSTTAVLAVTETPSGEPVDRFLNDKRMKRYQPADVDQLQSDLEKWLLGKGYRRIAIGQALPPNP